MDGTVKILHIERTTDYLYGNSIVKYEIPGKDFVSYIFSKQRPDDFDIKVAEEEIKEHIVSVSGGKGLDGFPLWSDLSNELYAIISDSCFNMKFIEFDDKECDEKKAEKIVTEASKYPSLQNAVTYGTDADAFVTVYAGALCSVNLFGKKKAEL